jgi:hypothetical protein
MSRVEHNFFFPAIILSEPLPLIVLLVWCCLLKSLIALYHLTM